MPRKWNLPTGANATLTRDEVAVIKRRLLTIKAHKHFGSKSPDSVARIAAEYGVSTTAIYAIRNRDTWQDVQPATEDEP